VREWWIESPAFYYDLFAPLGEIEIWHTDYIHVVESADAIVDWYRGTGLRPWLEVLPDESTRNRFIEDYRPLVTKAFPRQIDGRVLFPFRRFFLIAQKPANESASPLWTPEAGR
jgi:trans-aconitate 2-methyltransferase